MSWIYGLIGRYYVAGRAKVREKTDSMSLIEWAAAGVAVVLAVAVGTTPYTMSAAFIEIFHDFGTLDELPMLTQLVLGRTFAWTHTVLTAGLVGAALVARRSVRLRRVMLAGGCVLGVAGVGLYIYGIYSPLFEMTDIASP